jgi:radical SAM-linked protein
MQHIIKRSGLPVKYTEGFNPHYGVSFPMALPFGVESLCEVMDFKLEKELSFEEIKTKLNNAMPKGLKAISVSSPILDIKDIAFAEYEINGAENLSEFLKQDTIIIGKKSKQKHRKIIKEIDIRPNIELLSENTIRLPLSVLGGLNPVAVLEAYNKFFNINGDYRILKTKLLTAEYKDFR